MKIIYFEWYDAVGEGGWIHNYHQKDTNPILVQTIGFLIKEDDKSITVGLAYAPEVDHINSYLSVPKSWIKKRKYIKV